MTHLVAAKFDPIPIPVAAVTVWKSDFDAELQKLQQSPVRTVQSMLAVEGLADVECGNPGLGPQSQ